jgi:hypothetical protein
MKVYIYIVLALFLSVLSLHGCKEKRLMFEEAPAIYFTKFIVDPDSVNYSFGIRPAEITMDTVYLTMRIMGNSTPSDREIKLDVLQGSTAKAGYHYIMGPLVMPANTFQTRIPVYLFRKPGMKDSIISLNLRVADSKDFKQGYGDIAYVKTKLEYKINIDDQILKPANWDSSLARSFGTFSVVKFRLLIEATGRKIWTGLIGDGERANYVTEVKFALYNYEKLHGTLLDENGIPVTFP